MSRRQAFSAGLVAGAFFSSGCADEDAAHRATSDADLGEPERADEVYAAEVSTPVVTALPDESPAPNAEIRMARPRVPKSASGPSVPTHLIIEAGAESNAAQAREFPADEPQLERQSMLADPYAAFGAGSLHY